VNEKIDNLASSTEYIWKIQFFGERVH